MWFNLKKDILAVHSKLYSDQITEEEVIRNIALQVCSCFRYELIYYLKIIKWIEIF